MYRRPGRDRGQRELYVVVEGEVTERDYLALLNAEYGESGRFFIHPVTKRHGMQPLEVVERAFAQLGELRQAPGGDADIGEGRVQVWALFDRDKHTRIPEAFVAAAHTAVRVAFSHPSFDLWLLLHFQNMTSAEDGSSDAVHARLRAADLAFARYGRNGDKSVTGRRAQPPARTAA